MRAEDMGLVNLCVNAAWEELDNQAAENPAALYADSRTGVVEGEIDMQQLVAAVLECLWEEEGR